MENTNMKNTMDMATVKFLSALLIIVNNKTELSDEMSLADFLDWLDEKSKTEDYTSAIVTRIEELRKAC